MECKNHRSSWEAFCGRLNFLNVFSIIEQGNNQKQYQRLNHKSSHIKGEKISDVKLGMNAVKIEREGNGENNQH